MWLKEVIFEINFDLRGANMLTSTSRKGMDMSSTTDQDARRGGFIAAFRDHPASVGETYFGHMRFAFRFAGKLFVAGGAALVHAVIPPLCETTASRMVKDLSDMCNHRGTHD